MSVFTANPAYDNHMGNDVPNGNNDASATIPIGEHSGAAIIWRTLMKFALTSIPATASVVYATLSLTINVDLSANARTLRVYRCKRAWGQATATWNKYDGVNAWSTAGADGANDRDATDCGSLVLSASETGTKVIPLTASLIQEMISGVFTNNGFVLRMDTETDDAYIFESLESATPSIRPLITIYYDEGGFISISPYMMV